MREIKYPKKSKAAMGNIHRLGKKQSIETRLKISLANRGRKHWNKGGTISEQTKQKISLSRKGKSTPWMHNRKGKSYPWMYRTPSDETKNKLSETSKKAWMNTVIRKKYYDALEKTKWINVRTDIGQTELIEKWNRLGFNFELNFQLKTDNFLYYLDGYDKEKNVILEYDGQYHKKPNQKQKDLIRQKNIISAIHPKKFWRYDFINKKLHNVIG